MSGSGHSYVSREGAGLSVGRSDRDALHWLLVSELHDIGDMHGYLEGGEVDAALKRRRRFEQTMKLLDDLGWEEDTDRQRFELTMPHGQLRPILERLYWESVQSLADREGTLGETFKEQLETLVLLCPSLLSQIAEADSCAGPVVSADDMLELRGRLAGLMERVETECNADE